jgi:hypothetical protein
MVSLGGMKVPALSRVFARLRTLRTLILVYQENTQLPILFACNSGLSAFLLAICSAGH